MELHQPRHQSGAGEDTEHDDEHSPGDHASAQIPVVDELGGNGHVRDCEQGVERGEQEVGGADPDSRGERVE